MLRPKHHHADKMKPKYALEDYIYEMEARSLQQPTTDPEDVFAQLQQKEKDLILAAELGKALLEKNEELSRQSERLCEEYAVKLERLEQERHSLRRQLSTTQSEFDSRLLEVQSDLAEMTQALESKEAALKAAEREKASLVAELTGQNARLTERLKESNRTEEQLTAQLQGLKDQCHLNKSSLHDHASSLEVLRDEMALLSEQKAEMERRLQALMSQRDDLTTALEEATDRVVLLEQQARQLEAQLRSSQREVEQLRVTSEALSERLDSSRGSDVGQASSRSLLAEMSATEDVEMTSLADTLSLQEEALSACQTLRALCDQLRVRRGDSVCSEESESIHSLGPWRSGLLLETAHELATLLCRPSGAELEMELETELHRAREALERAQRQLQECGEQLTVRAEAVRELSGKLTVCETELACAREERDTLRNDLQDTSLAREDVVRDAWAAREAAVSKKNTLEVELARTRVELVQASSQLMEAVAQKVELSQQLDQWQIDMQSLLDDQMRSKLTSQEATRASAIPHSSKQTSSRRLFGLFQR